MEVQYLQSTTTTCSHIPRHVGFDIASVASVPMETVDYSNVDDTAKLHLVAAVLDYSSRMRVFAWADQFNRNVVIDSIGTVRPDLKSPVQKDPNLSRDLTKVPTRWLPSR